MGQARKRGTLEERVQQAKEKEHERCLALAAAQKAADDEADRREAATRASMTEEELNQYYTRRSRGAGHGAIGSMGMIAAALAMGGIGFYGGMGMSGTRGPRAAERKLR